MKGNLVIVCRDQDATQFDELMAEYGAFQTRLSSTAWYLKLDAQPEELQEEILARLGKYTTHYIFEAGSVTYNTVDSEAAAALDALFAEENHGAAPAGRRAGSPPTASSAAQLPPAAFFTRLSRIARPGAPACRAGR